MEELQLLFHFIKLCRLEFTYLFLIIICVTYTQCIFKWRMVKLQTDQSKDFASRINIYISDFWLLTALLSISLKFFFLALSLNYFDVGYVAMFLSLTNVSILIASRIFFNEEVGFNKIVALLAIIIGVILVSYN